MEKGKTTCVTVYDKSDKPLTHFHNVKEEQLPYIVATVIATYCEDDFSFTVEQKFYRPKGTTTESFHKEDTFRVPGTVRAPSIDPDRLN